MTTKDEALRLADELDRVYGYPDTNAAAAELRRLYAVNQELLELAQLLLRGLESGNIKAKPIIEMDDDAPMVQMQSLASIARAAIAKATGGDA